MLLLPVVCFVFNFRLSTGGHRSTSKNQTANISVMLRRRYLAFSSLRFYVSQSVLSQSILRIFHLCTKSNLILGNPVINFKIPKIRFINQVEKSWTLGTPLCKRYTTLYSSLLYNVEIFYSCLVASPFSFPCYVLVYFLPCMHILLRCS